MKAWNADSVRHLFDVVECGMFDVWHSQSGNSAILSSKTSLRLSSNEEKLMIFPMRIHLRLSRYPSEKRPSL